MNTKKKKDFPIILLLNGESVDIHPITPHVIDSLHQKNISSIVQILQKYYELNKKEFYIISLLEKINENVKDIILNSKLVKDGDINLKLLSGGKLEFLDEYPTIIEPVGSPGIIIVGDAVFLGINTYIGENCRIGDFSEITNSILLGNNKIGRKVIIENSIIGFDVEVHDNQIIRDTWLINQ